MTLRARALSFALSICLALEPGASATAADLPPGFVKLSRLAPDIAQDIRYARDFNFTGQAVPGYTAPECILTETTARALIRAEARLAAQGYGLVVFDCYRPARAVAFFAAWAQIKAAPGREDAIFFPGLSRTDLIPQGYIARRSGHSIGHTVDVGLRRAGVPPEQPSFTTASPCTVPFNQRSPETGLDLGTAFDCFSPLSGAGARLGAEAHANRARLAAAMMAEGFTGYDREWWHFRNARDPARTRHDFEIR
jgi:D-alanyl-D-alanine dipeptidase